MRYLFVISILLFCCTSSLSAQHIDMRWQPEFFSFPNKIVPFEGDWLVLGELQDQENNYAGYAVSRIGAQQIKWEVISPGERPHFIGGNGIDRNTGQVLLYTYAGSCDVFYYGDWCFIENNGVFSCETADENNLPTNSIHDIYKLDSTGHVLGRYFRSVVKYDDNFMNPVYKRLAEYPERMHQLVVSSDTLYWAGVGDYKGINKIKPVVSYGLNFTNQHDFPQLTPEEGELVIDINANSEDVFFCTEAAFYRYTFSDASFTRVPFPSSGIRFLQVASLEAEYLLLGIDGTQRTHLRRLDADLNLIENRIIDWDAIPVDFAVQNDTIALLGQYEINTGEYYGDLIELDWILPNACSMIAIKTIDLNNDPLPSKTDIALNSIFWNGQKEIIPTQCATPCEVELININLSGLSFTVQNQGLSTVEGFSIATRKNFCRNCESFCPLELGFWQHYDHILLPGQQISVSFDELMNFHYQPNTDEFDLCFWVTPGGAQTDKDYKDNILCESFLLNDSLIDTSAEAYFTAYPNPTNDYYQLDFSNHTFQERHEIYIYDSKGSLVHEFTLTPNVLSHKINMQQYSTGVYFLQWRNGQKQIVKRVVKR